MLKSIKLSLIYILINCNLVLASDKIKLISIEDVKIIFSTDIKSWNQNLIFLDKKLNMQKLQIENKTPSSFSDSAIQRGFKRPQY